MNSIRHLCVFMMILIMTLLISEIFYVSNISYASNKKEEILISKNTTKEKSDKKDKNNKNNKDTKLIKNKKDKNTKKKTKHYKDTVDYVKNLIDENQTRKAFYILSNYISRTPSPEAYYQMGRIYLINKDYKTAHQYFKKSSKYIDPDSAYDYGLMYYNLKNYYQAVKGFTTVAKGSYLKGIANFYAGVCYLELNRISDAEKYFRRAKKLPPRYEDLKQRYLNAIQSDTQGSNNYTLSSRMALPPMNDITTQSVYIDEKGEKHPVENVNINSGGFKFPMSLKLGGGVSGSGYRKTYVDVIETSDFKIKPSAEVEGRIDPNYSKTLKNKRDLKLSLPVALKITYGSGAPGGGKTSLGGPLPGVSLALSESPSGGGMSPEAGGKKSFMDEINTTLGFNPNVAVPVLMFTTLGAKYDLSLMLQGLKTETLKFNNFIAAYAEARISEINLRAELGATYNLSGLVSKSENSQAKAVAGIKGNLKVNGGAEHTSYNVGLDVQYNLQTEQNLADSVTNDMVIKGSAGFSLNGEKLGLDLGGIYTKNIDNEAATVEGSKTEEELNAKLRFSVGIFQLGLKGNYKIYPEYIYQNDNGYITTKGNSSGVDFSLNILPARWITLSTNVGYETNDYGIDEDWSANFYSKEKGHVLNKVNYGISAKLMFNF